MVCWLLFHSALRRVLGSSRCWALLACFDSTLETSSRGFHRMIVRIVGGLRPPPVPQKLTEAPAPQNAVGYGCLWASGTKLGLQAACLCQSATVAGCLALYASLVALGILLIRTRRTETYIGRFRIWGGHSACWSGPRHPWSTRNWMQWCLLSELISLKKIRKLALNSKPETLN